MQGKVLTVIVPTYNMEKYLDRCLSSLIVPDAQMAMLEVLVINDGSTDRSSEIAHGYESRYPGTFRVIDKSNGHYGSCVNRGLAEATGKYVKVLDADDWFDTEHFTDYLNFLAENDCDLFISETIATVADSDVREVWKFALKPQSKFAIKELKPSLWRSLSHQMIAYRLDMLRDISYSQSEGIAYTDLEWAFNPMAAVASCIYFPYSVYVYVLAREGQSVSPENHCRDIWMEQDVILKLLHLYEGQNNFVPFENRMAMQQILSSYIQRIYYHYLFSYPGLLPNEGLVEFDKNILQVSPELYYRIEDASITRKVITIRYIKEWRRRKCRRTFKFRCLEFGIIIRKVFNRFFSI